MLRKISSGGFGLVYLARDSTGQAVAIKEYLPSALVERTPGQRVPRVPPDKLSLYRLGLKNFFEEGRALAQISHPAVVGVMDFFRENETVYMVMNYLDGATLQDYVVAARKQYQTHGFSEETIRSLFDEILRGLRVVHQHRMLHLDLKPANIIITEDNRAVMLDFGAARQVLTQDPGFTRPMYTQGFAAPEMYGRKTELGPWTDIYAMGACMYSCMTGAPPVDVKARRKKDRFPEALERLATHYSAGLREVVAWAMALDPAARPQSVFELLKRLSTSS